MFFHKGQYNYHTIAHELITQTILYVHFIFVRHVKQYKVYIYNIDMIWKNKDQLICLDGNVRYIVYIYTYM